MKETNSADTNGRDLTMSTIKKAFYLVSASIVVYTIVNLIIWAQGFAAIAAN